MITGFDVVEQAKKAIGQPYKWGGKDTKKDNKTEPMDCSGLVSWVCMELGIDVPVETASAMNFRLEQKKLTCSVDDAFKHEGCLVFRYSKGSGRIVHVGITHQGGTIEERGKDYLCGWFPRRTNWTHAGMLPGVTYT